MLKEIKTLQCASTAEAPKWIQQATSRGSASRSLPVLESPQVSADAEAQLQTAEALSLSSELGSSQETSDEHAGGSASSSTAAASESLHADEAEGGASSSSVQASSRWELKRLTYEEKKLLLCALPLLHSR